MKTYLILLTLVGGDLPYVDFIKSFTTPKKCARVVNSPYLIDSKAMCLSTVDATSPYHPVTSKLVQADLQRGVLPEVVGWQIEQINTGFPLTIQSYNSLADCWQHSQMCAYTSQFVHSGVDI